MPIDRPSERQISDIAAGLGIDLSAQDAASFADLVARVLPTYERLDELVEPTLPVTYAREPGHRPTAEENPNNAWYWKTAIEGAPGGPLAGRRVAIKDNISVAGVPMMNGSLILEGHVPELDATVVTRILDAGGTIVGKAACEDMCFSGASHTCKSGRVANPHRPTHSAGGSSSGCGALLATGEIDMAIGGDQGGSIRIPSSWCGVVGLKPTYGLVPYTGAFPIEMTLDHVGPMARTVRDVASLLAVVAGADGFDPRQTDAVVGDYLSELDQGAAGLRVGVVLEGFDRPDSEAATDEAVRAAVSRFAELGASVSEVSIPMHLDGPDVWAGIQIEGAAQQLLGGNGLGTNWVGHYATGLQEAYVSGLRSRPDDLCDTVKVGLFLGEYVRRVTPGTYYAKAQNLRRSLRSAYDEALASFDVLAMPTIPFRATEIPSPECAREEYVARSHDMGANTCPFDATGHPALSVPCGAIDDLPIGLMLIGRHWGEATVLRLGAAFEDATSPIG